MQMVLEHIAALEAMMQLAPIVSGSFMPAPFLYLARSLHQELHTLAGTHAGTDMQPYCTGLGLISVTP